MSRVIREQTHTQFILVGGVYVTGFRINKLFFWRFFPVENVVSLLLLLVCAIFVRCSSLIMLLHLCRPCPDQTTGVMHNAFSTKAIEHTRFPADALDKN